MKYFDIEAFGVLFDVIYTHYTGVEKAPDYRSENHGIGKLVGVMVGVKADKFYPGFFDKATYILVQINKGHFFSNGNKRAALVFLLHFIFINNYDVKRLTKERYKRKTASLFPVFDSYTDYPDFLPEEFAYYNLSLIIAESKRYTASFDDLKERVKAFLKFSIQKKVRSKNHDRTPASHKNRSKGVRLEG